MAAVLVSLSSAWSGLVFAGAPFSSLTEPIRREIGRIEREVASLPTTPINISPWTLGYSSTQHEAPAWPVQIDITFLEPALVDLVALLPATYADNQGMVQPFGFPQRFSIERVLSDGSTRPLADHLDADYAVSGIEPQIFSCADPQATQGLRVTITRPAPNPTWWHAPHVAAFSELFAFAGERNVALNAGVKASSSFTFSYVWAPSCLTDGFSLFAPIDLQLSNPEANFLGNHDKVAIGIDLGTERRVDEFRLWPVVHSIQHNFPNSSGVGFPIKIRLEIAATESFENARVLHMTNKLAIQPGSGPLMLRTAPASGRFVRLTLEHGFPDFRVPHSKRIWLSEVEMLEAGQVVSQNARAWIVDEVRAPLKLTDGQSNEGRILPLRGWVTRFHQRKQLERRLLTLRQELDAAQRQEEARAGKLILIALALIVALLQVVWLVRAAAKRRWERMRERIGCDLHDELGANVSSIAHMAELLSETIEKPTEQQTRLLTSLLENARLTSREARQLVRLVKADDHDRDLNVQMRDVAGQIVGGIPIEFSLAETRRFRRLDALTRWNLILFYKEALNNVIKHSGARSVKVTTREADSARQLVVEDNGCGLPETAPRPRHLENRAKILGGKVEISSRPGQGTRVTLTF